MLAAMGDATLGVITTFHYSAARKWAENAAFLKRRGSDRIRAAQLAQSEADAGLRQAKLVGSPSHVPYPEDFVEDQQQLQVNRLIGIPILKFLIIAIKNLGFGNTSFPSKYLPTATDAKHTNSACPNLYLA
jgi:hypothetical protein